MQIIIKKKDDEMKQMKKKSGQALKHENLLL